MSTVNSFEGLRELFTEPGCHLDISSQTAADRADTDGRVYQLICRSPSSFSFSRLVYPQNPAPSFQHLSQARLFDENGEEILQMRSSSVQRSPSNPFKGVPSKVDVVDAQDLRLKFSIPQAPAGLYIAAAIGATRLYSTIGCSTPCYDPLLGAYAELRFTKNRDQAEREKKEIYSSLGIEHDEPLHSDEDKSWSFSLFSASSDESEKSVNNRYAQISCLYEIVQKFRAMGCFQRVFIPTPEFRFHRLGEAPGYIATADEIVIQFRRLPSEKRADFESDIVSLFRMRGVQESARKHYQDENSGIASKFLSLFGKRELPPKLQRFPDKPIVEEIQPNRM